MVPGIPVKDVSLGSKVTAELDASNPIKVVRLLDKTSLSDWADFEKLHNAWVAALAHLQSYHGEIMRKIKQDRDEFTAKDAEGVLHSSHERSIWIATALKIPEARRELIKRHGEPVV